MASLTPPSSVMAATIVATAKAAAPGCTEKLREDQGHELHGSADDEVVDGSEDGTGTACPVGNRADIDNINKGDPLVEEVHVEEVQTNQYQLHESHFFFIVLL